MSLVQYLPHIIYTTALTSVATHHLSQRKAFEAERAHVAAQISILEDLRVRLSSVVTPNATSTSGNITAIGASSLRSAGLEGPLLDEREVDRLWRLARSHDVWRAREASRRGGPFASHNPAYSVQTVQDAEGAGEIGWKEVLFGRRFDTGRTEELDRNDLDRGGLSRRLGCWVAQGDYMLIDAIVFAFAARKEVEEAS
ncbi:hypothetical protein BN946_scf184936.g10 [Trametes cinnabarina]|uniref:Uncharacterized protein n=1 Tax=Pycnoporus cinnabarinus TaxID=5643 RepID=A0A060ST63_PYCCI|nr:hypothetical protein BN946_scf184936.g10 [Trametes cinnabarina]